ncbi:hypothetical protein BSKO_02213 [Bryopsis sp. KO-2023]|nr:hypothetical protein BSKO_02213 [Bryopsis sp. KO-2023]
MIVPIQGCPAGTSPQKWGLLEFKGEMQTEKKSAGLDGQTLGSIRQSDEDASKVHIRIEHNELDGTRKKLGRPYLVLERVAGEKDVKFKVVGVVNSKLDFSEPMRYVGGEK